MNGIIETDYAETGSSYLESRMKQSLIEAKLIDKQPHRIFYDPQDFGAGYRSFRRGLIDYVVKPITHNIYPLSILGLFSAVGLVYFCPDTVTTISTAKGLGVAGAAGLVGKVFNLDEMFDETPAKIARRMFRNNRKPWREAYDNLTIGSKRSLDKYVIMAQNPQDVYDNYSDRKNAQALGISISKVADILAGLIPDSEKVKGFTLQNVLEMFSVQKIGNDEETKVVYELMDKYSSDELCRKIYLGIKEPGMDVLSNIVWNHRLALFISEAKVPHVATKMGRGEIFVEEDIGRKAGSFLGYYSKDKDFPCLVCGDDADQQFMNRAIRGYGYVGGNAEQGLMEGSTGGVVIVRGNAYGEIAKGMTDSTWPAVIFSLGGIHHNLYDGSIKNGMIVSLNRNIILNRPPTIFRFEGGKMESEELEDNSHTAKIACNRVNEYIQGWEKKRAA